MGLKGLTTADLRKELARRAKGADKLHLRRAKLLKEIEALDAELAFLGGEAATAVRPGRGGPKRPRARNEISLPDAIAQAMELRAVVSPKEAAELVRANGFQTTSKNFNMMVSNALAKDERFKRLGRGQYERIG